MTIRNTESKLLVGFKRFLLFGGIFNIIAGLPFIFPWTYKLYIKMLSDMNQNFNLGGIIIPLNFDPFSSVIINCAGNSVVLIGAIIIYCSLDPKKHLTVPLLNAIARILFFFIVLYYVIYYNLAKVMLGFGIMDLLIGVGFLYYLVRLKKMVPTKTQ
jgi:hypothetical protein